MRILPVEPAYRLADKAADSRWLVEGLWGEGAVGIVGGEPKCCKSFLTLDLAVHVHMDSSPYAREREQGTPSKSVLRPPSESELLLTWARSTQTRRPCTG